ncbi:MAG TPA: urease accessory UreF family protein, partial [Solirubrobacteraceae bacterium]|nr:urease accessory UreF family protein [Solirubrobacteraceae bacterium]
SAGAVATLLLADSRFPAGSYAHSLGLEQAVSEGLGVDGVARFIGARLRLVAQPEAALSVAARRAVAATESGHANTSTSTAGADPVLAALDDEHAARCPSPVLRDVARRLGSQLLRSAATAWPCAAIDRYRSASTTTPRPVALGVVGAAAGLSDVEVATIALYDDAATVACAALKLLGLDPAQTTRWLADLAPWIGTVAREVADDRRPVARQPPPAAVGLELAASRHARRRERLFVS